MPDNSSSRLLYLSKADRVALNMRGKDAVGLTDTVQNVASGTVTCVLQLTVGSQAKSVLTGAIVDGAATRTIFQAVATLANLGLESKFPTVVL